MAVVVLAMVLWSSRRGLPSLKSNHSVHTHVRVQEAAAHATAETRAQDAEFTSLAHVETAAKVKESTTAPGLGGCMHSYRHHYMYWRRVDGAKRATVCCLRVS